MQQFLVLYYPFKACSIALGLFFAYAKAYSALKNKPKPLFSTLLKRASRDAKTRIMENDRSAKKALLSNKEEQHSSYFS